VTLVYEPIYCSALLILKGDLHWEILPALLQHRKQSELFRGYLGTGPFLDPGSDQGEDGVLPRSKRSKGEKEKKKKTH
jgi:hypothetical protein